MGQMDLEGMEKWAHGNTVKFNQVSLYLRRNKPKPAQARGSEWLASSYAEIWA